MKTHDRAEAASPSNQGETPSAHDERAPNERPVAAVGPVRIAVPGGGVARAYASDNWLESGPAVEPVDTALILLHGRLRNAHTYQRFAEAATQAAGRTLRDTLIVTPQFLAEADLAAHRLPPDTLGWTWTGWMGGDAALTPSPVSSFEVLDALLAQLTVPGRYPNLKRIVVAGHSGGAQVAHRFAVLARGDSVLREHGLALRYVIANPSSYVYFDAQRPAVTDRTFASLTQRPESAALLEFANPVPTDCAGFDQWKYGTRDLPDYANGASAAALEQAYVRRDVVYLWGERDCDPAHPALDTSCAATTQGPNRLARGLAYFEYLRRRHPGQLTHRGYRVPGVGHDGSGMLTSPAGLRALFGDA